MRTLYGVSPSPFVRKVRIALAEKGVSYELEPVMPGASDEAFRAISPLGKVPVFRDGEYTLPDSSCILLYLERCFPEPALYPDDPRKLGWALFIEEYSDTRLIEAIGPIFSQRVIQAKLYKQPADETLVQLQCEHALPPSFAWLEAQISGEGGLVGHQFGIADLSVVSNLINLSHAGIEIDSGRWPKLARYLEEMTARPSIAQIIQEERAAFAALTGGSPS